MAARGVELAFGIVADGSFCSNLVLSDWVEGGTPIDDGRCLERVEMTRFAGDWSVAERSERDEARDRSGGKRRQWG